MDLIFVLALDALFFVVILGVVVFGVSKINYQIDEHYLRMRIGSFLVRKIAVDDIQAVEIGYSDWVEGWANTLRRKTIKEKAVTVYRKSGKLRKIVLTPADQKQFVATLKKHPRFTPHES